jgi:hypothetical protein
MCVISAYSHLLICPCIVIDSSVNEAARHVQVRELHLVNSGPELGIQVTTHKGTLDPAWCRFYLLVGGLPLLRPRQHVRLPPRAHRIAQSVPRHFDTNTMRHEPGGPVVAAGLRWARHVRAVYCRRLQLLIGWTCYINRIISSRSVGYISLGIMT